MDNAAVMVILGVFAVFFTVFFADFKYPGALYSLFTPEHVDYLKMFDSRNQNFAYKLALAAAALFTLGGMVFYRQMKKPFLKAPASFLLEKSGLILIIITAAAALLRGRLVYTAFDYPVIDYAVILAVSFASAFLYVKFWDKIIPPVKKIILVSGAVFAVLLVVSGLFFKPVMISDGMAKHILNHYNIVVSPADKLAAGLVPGKEVRAGYGILMPLFLSAIEAKTGILNMAGHVKFVGFLQVLFFIIAILTFYLWKPKNTGFMVLAMLLIAPWLSTLGTGCDTPNQSGYRSMGFPLGLLVLLLVKDKKTVLTAAVLGFCSVYLFLLNTETGITLGAAYIVFLAFKTGVISAKNIISVISACAAGVAAGAASFYIFYSVVTGAASPVSFTGVFFDYMPEFLGGYAGLQLHYDAFIAVLFIHGLFVLSHGAMAGTKKIPDPNEAFRMAVASAILAWLAYYINRPHYLNFWTYIYLYIFLIPGYRAPKGREAGLLKIIFNKRAALAACVLFPLIISAGRKECVNIADKLRFLQSGGNSVVSGVAMPGFLAGGINGKIAFIKNSGANGNNCLIFSQYGYLISLETGIFNRLPFNDPDWASMTEAGFLKNADMAGALKKEKIFFDYFPANTRGYDGYTMHFYNRFKDKIRDLYRLNSVQAGMEEWVLK